MFQDSIFNFFSPLIICSLIIWRSTLKRCIGSAWDGSHFPRAALPVLSFALAAGKVLITPQSFGHCWAALALRRCPLSNPSSSRMEVGKILRGDTARTANSNWPKGNSVPYEVCSAIKVQRKEEEKGASISYCDICLPGQPLHILKTGFPKCVWTSPADGKYTINLCFPLLSREAFALLNCLHLDIWIFFSYFLPALACKGKWQSSLVDIWCPAKVNHHWSQGKFSTGKSTFI